MIIVPSSIRSHFYDFDGLIHQLSSEYNAWLDASSFSFECDQNEAPTSENLKTIFYRSDALLCDVQCKEKKHQRNHGPNCIEGMLHEDNFEASTLHINECLSSDGFPPFGSNIFNMLDLLPAPPEVAQTRISVYWETIDQFFQLPPTRVYRFENTTGAFFGEYVFWGFTYVYLNDATKTGIVLDGGAAD